MPKYRITYSNGSTRVVEAPNREAVLASLHGRVIQTQREAGSDSKRARMARTEYKAIAEGHGAAGIKKEGS